MPWLLEKTVLISVLMLPAVLYLMWRLHAASRQISQIQWTKLILPLLVCSFYAFPVSGAVDFYATGNIDVLKYPKSLVYWFWFGLVFIFQLTTWVLAADVIKLVSRFWANDLSRINRWHARAVVALFAIIFIFVGWKTYRDTTTVITEKTTLPVENLPQSVQDFKLVHISDIQGDEYTGREEIKNYIQTVNSQNPDLIIFTGDLISYGTDFIKQSAEELGAANAQYGTYAVVGDHDYWAGTKHIEKALAAEGIPLLQDENKLVKIDSAASVVLTGVTQVYSKNSDPVVVDSLTTSVKNAALKIFVSHQVKDQLITSARQSSYSILLAGHTHGGQIRVPFLGMSFSAAGRETPYISGLYQEKVLPIHINNGLGFTLGPIRYDAPPAVSVIKFVEK